MTVLAPPAGGVRAACGPCQILAGKAVARLELVETGGEALFGRGDHRVRFLPTTGSVFVVSCTAQHFSCPALGVLPLLLRRLSLDIGERPRQGEVPLGKEEEEEEGG